MSSIQYKDNAMNAANAAKPTNAIALVDCDAFYASCERVFNPKLHRHPVIVLSNNDGCIVARSKEAKEIGIPRGAPRFQYEDLICRHDVAVFSSNYELYGDISCRVMSILEQSSDDVEPYSIGLWTKKS